MLRYAHKAPLKLSHFCRTFQAPPGGYNKKKPTIQAAFETVNRGFSFGALEGTRIPGPLIKRIKGASFVKFQKFEEALFLSYHRKHAFAHTALFVYSVMLCNRYPAIQVCKKCAKMCRRAKQSPMDKSTTGFMAGFRTSEQTPFDIKMRFTMNKLLSCRH